MPNEREAMRSLFPSVLVMYCVFFSFSEVALARKVESWPYEELLEKSDVAVIATAVSTSDCKDTFSDNPWKVQFEGVETKFRVKAVLRGKVGDRSIELLINGERVVDACESCFFASYRESNAKAFGVLYERLASQARVAFAKPATTDSDTDGKEKENKAVSKQFDDN